jgi:hypothetical protein
VATNEFALDDVLAGRVVWREHLACIREPAGGNGHPSVAG